MWHRTGLHTTSPSFPGELLMICFYLKDSLQYLTQNNGLQNSSGEMFPLTPPIRLQCVGSLSPGSLRHLPYRKYNPLPCQGPVPGTQEEGERSAEAHPVSCTPLNQRLLLEHDIGIKVSQIVCFQKVNKCIHVFVNFKNEALEI